MLFEVNNPEANNLPVDEGDDSSDIDLANFWSRQEIFKLSIGK